MKTNFLLCHFEDLSPPNQTQDRSTIERPASIGERHVPRILSTAFALPSTVSKRDLQVGRMPLVFPFQGYRPSNPCEVSDLSKFGFGVHLNLSGKQKTLLL